MKGSSVLLLVCVAAVLTAGGIWYAHSSAPQESSDANVFNPAAVPPAEENTHRTSEPSASGYAGALLAGTEISPLLDFNPEDYEKAIDGNKLVVLYFYATWCPVCTEEFPIVEEVFNTMPLLSSIQASEVVGFRVNYNDSDTDAAEKALARDFGVAYQHTKVLVKNGMRILKSPEAWSKERYLQEIRNAL